MAMAMAISLWLIVFKSVTLLRLGRAEDVLNNPETASPSFSIHGSPFTLTAGSSSTNPANLRSARASLRLARRPCSAPRQPVNGEWKIRQELCPDDIKDCKIPEGTALEATYQLVYSCNPGYALRGNADVICQAWGSWTPIPVCDEIKCPALNSVGRTARCARFRKSVSCDFPVPPRTRAEVSCRPGYKVDTTYSFAPGNILDCNEEGKWEPVPIRCIPACGKVATRHTPYATFAAPAKISDFPWHATLYFEEKSSMGTGKTFICGATIIQANLLLTAGHCVYDEIFERTIDPKKLFVLTGNENRDYDSPNHDYRIVKKAEVKNIYVSCNFYGLRGSYAADIALLELRKPFVLSQILLPACLDLSGYSDQFLWTRPSGKVAGFGRTETEETSKVLRTLTVPYIPNSECRDSRNAATNRAFITLDKFCAGHSNGSAVSSGDSGGGLVFEQYGLWYVMGIVSVGLGVDTTSGVGTVDRYAYSLYTKLSVHIDWIQDVVYNLKTYEKYPACTPDPSMIDISVKPAIVELITVELTTELPPAEGVPLSNKDALCTAPPQPANGQWKSHLFSCNNGSDCSTAQEFEFEPESQLVYTCARGYRVRGNTDVYCLRSGNWSAIPVCREIRCESLTSESRRATCSGRFGEYVNCDFPVLPGTWARLHCSSGFKMEMEFATNRRPFAQCGENGTWLSEPIRCSPVCGVAITHQRPLVANGTTANIGDFPWHATLYKQTYLSRLGRNGGKKELICGATIIQTNLLLTAAHCVYDEATWTTENPENLFVVTGNIFRDYDSPLHNPVSVSKSAVKNVYKPCNYYGFIGNYASDIALLQLQDPFQLSSILLPACLDVSGFTEQILKPGATGRVAGFGRTATGEPSGVLQTLELPYVSYIECQKSFNSDKTKAFITNDKFCAGFTDGSAVCDADGGGGLAFKQGDLWYVLGIVSLGQVDLGNVEATCDSNSYSLYTKVVQHIDWIQQVMFEVETNGFYKSCDVDE